MRTKPFAWILGAAATLLSTAGVSACGGRAVTSTGNGGGALGVGSSSSGANDGTGASSSGSNANGGGSGVTCMQSTGGGGSNGDGTCQMSSAGTCSDGTEFDINCSCPAATCTCSKGTASGGTQTSQISVACPAACSEATDALVQACNFGAGQGTVTPPADAGLPACTVPASMQPPSQPGAWSVARALLQCSGNGLNTICESSDGTTCPNDPVVVGGSCTDDCAPNQYVVGFGGPPMFDDDAGYLTPPLLASCSGGTGLPSGTSFACCPCQ